MTPFSPNNWLLAAKKFECKKTSFIAGQVYKLPNTN
jgi:hypothetical protein